MKNIVGDIRSEKQVIDALQGVDCVIHCAAVVDVSLWPDERQMQTVNIDGNVK